MQRYSLLTAGMLITVGMLLGRVLGLLREIALASRFGVGPQADSAILLLVIPDAIASALIFGSASATLVPAFASRDSAALQALFWQALIVSFGAFSVIALLLCILPFSLPAGVGGSFDAKNALILALCSLPWAAVTAVITAYLQWRRRLVVPAFSNAIFNGVVVAALLLLPMNMLAFGGVILAAGGIRLIVHGSALRRLQEVRFQVKFTPWQLDASLLSTYLITTATSILSVLPMYMPYSMVAFSGGGVALFNYAFKLVLLPGMLIQTFLQMALFPWLVGKRADADDQALCKARTVSVQLSWLMAWMVGLILAWAAPEITQICFGYGQMTEENVHEIAHLMRAGVWLVVPSVLACVWQQILYADGRTTSALHGNGVQALAIVPLYWLGMKLGGLSGSMVACVIVAILPLIALLRDAKKQGIITSYYPDRAYIMSTLIASTVFILPAWGLSMVELPALLYLAMLAGLGIIALISGAWQCSHIREQIIQRIKQ